MGPCGQQGGRPLAAGVQRLSVVLAPGPGRWLWPGRQALRSFGQGLGSRLGREAWTPHESRLPAERSAPRPALLPPRPACTCPEPPGLLGLAAVGGLLPLQALLAAGGRRPCPQALEPAALGADADVCAAAGHQGGLLGQSLRQLVGFPGPAQLAVAERRGAARPALLGNGGPRRRHPSSPPAGVDTVLTQDDAAQLGHHLLADGHLGGGEEEVTVQCLRTSPCGSLACPLHICLGGRGGGGRVSELNNCRYGDIGKTCQPIPSLYLPLSI